MTPKLSMAVRATSEEKGSGKSELPFLVRPGRRMACFRVAILAMAFAAAGLAQPTQVPWLRPGSIEAGGFVGASYGIVNAQYMAGGNLTIAATERILPYVEYTYLPGVALPNVSVPAGTTYTSDRNASFSDFHGGVHIRLPIHESPVVPYLVVGAGVLTHFKQSYTITEMTPGFSSTTLPQTVAAGSDFAFNAGFGIRYYLRSERFGFRTEAKFYKPTGLYNRVFGKAEFGFFYQFR